MTLKKNNTFALLIFAVVIHGDYFCYLFLSYSWVLSFALIVLYLCEYV